MRCTIPVNLLLTKQLSKENQHAFRRAIYVGKAVPRGWRQGIPISNISATSSFELYQRLKEHLKSINQVQSLSSEDFYCRLMILEGSTNYLISTVEAAIIQSQKPLWNAVIDGFGNHDPDSGRYNQAKSDWDVLHSSRPWAKNA
jgi:hypothetical protein